ncbi:MORN repeat-containing protein 3-like [Teleopsis dalmanni]|uniref:MORN repeat-containing protein 3-like n=1 Tax=Teleopsis dalmanni TaxID=139649 RepID=UPI0018CDF860|nr:MORN repeat-containing protein 3-like [Teleopsis dalmanni]XP_037951282.1 MORN repeat-containing protein 3-like [Teleopsis dalmanni]XP_037951292.1 MORN repeat-containing protein 3-like [Teleopsis dalmanni]XP_037951445.1 MORN repeat-containing protein 3-like [Teleopsis dalmanni]
MSVGCYVQCKPVNHEKGESTGWRGTFFYPGGGTYKGYWTKSKQDHYGVKITKKGMAYDGQWLDGKRHGFGTMRKSKPDGTYEKYYVGDWKCDKKSGEGKQFFPDGVYYGWWRNNRRDGLGIMWFEDGTCYLGEWRSDYYHGVGVFFYLNGNRYEGHYAQGLKNGEGTFYHNHTGQIQKGMWENDICKTSMIIDEFRNQVDHPSEYPIPPLRLVDPNKLIRNFFRPYMVNADKPPKSLQELLCIKFVQKFKRLNMIDPKGKWYTKIQFDDPKYICTCKELEKPIVLRQRIPKL